MASDHTILASGHEKNPRPPPPLKNYGVHTIKPQLRPRLLTLPEHLSSPPVFTGVRVTRSLVLYACHSFVDRCLSFCTFSFGHCVVCSSSIYGC